MSRSILLQKVDPKAENGTGSFPPADIRSALEAIGGPFFKEWSLGGGGGDGYGGIGTGEQIPCTSPDGCTNFGSSIDTFLSTVKNGQVDSLGWDRPLGREGTIRALWHLIEIHRFSLIDPSGGGDHPRLYVLSEACLEDVEQVWPGCRESGVRVFSGYEDFRSHFES